MDAAIQADDNGPPVLPASASERCTMQVTTTKDKGVSAEVSLHGHFFSGLVQPVATDKSVTVVSKALTDADTWLLTVTAADRVALRRGVLQFKGTSAVDSYMVRLSGCKGAP